MNEYRVRKIYINNRKLFEEILIKELTNKKINYLQIEHEFHILDKIYILYEKDFTYQEKQYNLDLNNVEFILEKPKEEKPKIKQPIYKYQKKLIRQQNYMLNQLLKNKSK